MEGRISIDMISDGDLREMNYQMTHMRPNLRPDFDNIRDILKMYMTDIIREGDLPQISMRIPYTDIGTFQATFYSDEVILINGGMFAVASLPQWANCAQGICRERLCLSLGLLFADTSLWSIINFCLFLSFRFSSVIISKISSGQLCSESLLNVGKKQNAAVTLGWWYTQLLTSITK